MNQYCVFINNSSVTSVNPTFSSGAGWPGVLVTSPFIFKYNNINYNLNQEGIYKFHVPMQNTTNIVIYDGDVLKLMESLTYFIVPGQANEGESNSSLNTRALTSRFHIMCTSSALWVKYWCGQLNIPSRLVRVIRSGTPNNFYDGHVIIEVKINNEWKLFDPNVGFSFKDNNGNLLSVKDTCPVTDISVFNKLHLLKDGLPSEQMVNNIYHHSSTIDIFLATDNDLKNWQKEVMQIPGIVHTDNKTYFYMPSGTESRQSWIESLDPNYIVVNYSTWVSMFY